MSATSPGAVQGDAAVALVVVLPRAAAIVRRCRLSRRTGPRRRGQLLVNLSSAHALAFSGALQLTSALAGAATRLLTPTPGGALGISLRRRQGSRVVRLAGGVGFSPLGCCGLAPEIAADANAEDDNKPDSAGDDLLAI
jgi:hypothetical protein